MFFSKYFIAFLKSEQIVSAVNYFLIQMQCKPLYRDWIQNKADSNDKTKIEAQILTDTLNLLEEAKETLKEKSVVKQEENMAPKLSMYDKGMYFYQSEDVPCKIVQDFLKDLLGEEFIVKLRVLTTLL